MHRCSSFELIQLMTIIPYFSPSIWYDGGLYYPFAHLSSRNFHRGSARRREWDWSMLLSLYIPADSDLTLHFRSCMRLFESKGDLTRFQLPFTHHIALCTQWKMPILIIRLGRGATGFHSPPATILVSESIWAIMQHFRSHHNGRINTGLLQNSIGQNTRRRHLDSCHASYCSHCIISLYTKNGIDWRYERELQSYRWRPAFIGCIFLAIPSTTIKGDSSAPPWTSPIARRLVWAW